MYYKFMSICGRRIKERLGNLHRIQRTKFIRMKFLQQDCLRKGKYNLLSTYYMLRNGNNKYLLYGFKELWI